MTVKRFNRISWIAAATVALIAMTVYALTAEPTASFWDCPEYVATAARLEVGHPPGNPVWTLTAHLFTLLAPDVEHAAFAVNLMSGVASALAVMYLCLTVSLLLRRLLARDAQISIRRSIAAWAGSVAASLTLAFSDTFWFSAVETEVYAFSVFLTALMVWLALLAGEHYGRPRSMRYVVLLAYLSGFSIGVHQLNLLCLPVLALIMLFYGYSELRPRKIVIALVGSVLIIAGILFGMMPWTLRMGGWADILAVNILGWNPWSGVLIYLFTTLATCIAASWLLSDNHTRMLLFKAGVEGTRPVSPIRFMLTYILAALALFLSGILCFAANLWVGILLSIAAASWLYMRREKHPLKIMTAFWSLTLLLIGYGAYALIPIRAVANPPMNEGMPRDIFLFESYVQRDQYGSTPMLHGPTPFSRPLHREKEIIDPSTGEKSYDYSSFAYDSGRTRYAMENGRYVAVHHSEKLRYEPETQMWFPRIYSRDAADIKAYAGWTGMDSTNMVRVKTSYAVDADGNIVDRFDTTLHRRVKGDNLRPSYWQNIKMLFGYQVSYMYMRYLMWNFVGRQNDIYANGESDAGNFITGITPIDDLMLQDSTGGIPAYSRENPGRRTFFFIPLFVGILGACMQLSRRKRGRRQFIITMLLFLLSGLAIVVYLNQTPGQPRERDYSFVGSFYAFAIWIGTGICFIIRKMGDFERRKFRNRLPITISAAVLLGLAIPIWMFAENLPDHSRAGRTLTRDVALNTMTLFEPDAIYFMNGDNYTFPIWYIQEVEGVRKDVRSVNLAYLTTPWYVYQLTTPTDGGRPIAMTLPPEMRNRKALARYSSVALAQTDTLPAVEALRRLYEWPAEKGKPRFEARWLSVPSTVAGEQIIIDSHDAANSSSKMYIDRLMMLDIIVTNAADGWQRPIYWSRILTGDRLMGLRPYTSKRATTLQLTPSAPGYQADKTFDDISRRWRFGGLKNGVYVDPPGVSAAREMRHAITELADTLIARGRKADALALARLSEREIPRRSVEYGVYVVNGQVLFETLDLARIYFAAGDSAAARRLLRTEKQLLDANHKYLKNLSPRYRKYTRPEIRNREVARDSALSIIRAANL